MRFIFRNPFVTKKDKILAKSYIEMAECLAQSAELAKDENGVPDARLVVRAIDMWDKAAKVLGFRNIKDMHDYINIHGKL